MRSLIFAVMFVLFAAGSAAASEPKSWVFGNGTYTHIDGVRVSQYSEPPIAYTHGGHYGGYRGHYGHYHYCPPRYYAPPQHYHGYHGYYYQPQPHYYFYYGY